MSADPTAVGITSTRSAPTSAQARADLTARPEQVGVGHSTWLGRARAGGEGGVENIDVDGKEVGRLIRDLKRALHHRSDPQVANLVHEQAGDPWAACQANSASPGQ